MYIFNHSPASASRVSGTIRMHYHTQLPESNILKYTTLGCVVTTISNYNTIPELFLNITITMQLCLPNTSQTAFLYFTSKMAFVKRCSYTMFKLS
jgi:hypothetical protein